MTSPLLYSTRPSDYFLLLSADTDLMLVSKDYPRGLYVGGAGNVNLKRLDGTNVLFTGLLAGQILPVQFQQVVSSTTTATLLIALY